jgi:hypothetical protein
MNVAPWTNRRNSLVYPTGRNPGFDPTHVACCGYANLSNGGTPGVKLSYIAVGKGFTNILTGGGTSSQNTGTVANYSPIGPCYNCTGSKSFISTSPGDTVGYPSATLAAIVVTPTPLVSGAIALGVGSTAVNSFNLGNNSGPVTLGVSNGTQASTVASLVAGTPYFIIGSGMSGNSNLAATNLLTGQIVSTHSTATFSVGVGNPLTVGMEFGILNNGNRPWDGYIATAMYSNFLMPMSAVLAWAVDPWAFWYPRSKFAGGF